MNGPGLEAMILLWLFVVFSIIKIEKSVIKYYLVQINAYIFVSKHAMF